MTTRSLFGLLVLAQAAHSVEEYAGRLWESFPPAMFLTRLVSENLEFGFLVINIGLVALGVVAWARAIAGARAVASGIVWFYVSVEFINGVGHPIWSLVQSGYTPGLGTAPVLLLLSILVARATMKDAPRRVSSLGDR